jgi:hypothetical protein
MKQVAENLVHEANLCGVDLKITPTYVSQVPKDLFGLKALSKERCKAANLDTNPPHPHASVIVVVGPQSSLPSVACNNPSREQPGCGEWTAPPDKAVQQSLMQSGNSDETPVVPGQETFSVIRGGSLAAGAAFQWGVGVALGQLVPGNSVGRGLSFAEEGAYVGSGGSPSDPLLPGACESLRRNAYSRPGVPQPDRSKYVIARDDPSYFLNLATGNYEGGGKGMMNAVGGVVSRGAKAANSAVRELAEGAASAPSGKGNLGDTFEKGGGAHKKPVSTAGAAKAPTENAPSVKPITGGAPGGLNLGLGEPPPAQKLPDNQATPETAVPPE